MEAHSSLTAFRAIPVLIALLMNAFLGPFAPVIGQGISDVLAAPATIADEDGANDEPGQKDLTQLTIDYAGLPTSVDVSWNWDEISWSGANTGDACALFDTNDNFKVDAAVCVTISGDPATLFDVRLFDCTADAKVDRCTGPSQVASPPLTDCTVAQTDTDPFLAGDEHPTDTTAWCTIYLGEVAAANAELVNVCSYPSQEPNSDPSDCVLIIRDGFLTVVKVATPNDPAVTFNFTLDGGALGSTNGSGQFTAAVIPSMQQNPVAHNLVEQVPSGWSLDSSSCDNGDPTSAIEVGSGETVTCTFNNSLDRGALEVVKNLVPETDPGLFNLQIAGVTEAGNVGDGGTTGERMLSTGTYSVGETAGTGSNLDRYAIYLECRNGNGVGPIVASTFGAGPLDVSVGNGDDIVCKVNNTRRTGRIEVVKDLSPSDDPGLFNLQIDGSTRASDAGDAGTTGEVTLNTGSHTVGETAGTGSSISDYASSIVCRGSNGTGATLASGNGAGLLTINVFTNADIVCTITNVRETGDLTVIKNLSPDDDPGLFNLMIDDSTELANASDGDSTGAITVNTGGHTVGETAGSGTSLGNYASSIECIDGGGEGDVVVSGAGAGPLPVDIGHGDDIVCTITNTRVAVGFDKANDQGDNAAVEPGETIHYTLTVAVEDGDATNVVVTDELPDGLTYVANSAEPSAGFSIVGHDLTWDVGTLAEGSHTFEYDATVDADASGSLVNLGCVDVDQNDELVCDETTLRVPTLVVDKAANAETITISGPINAPVATPSVITWTLSYTLANGPVTNAVITDVVPAGLVYVPNSASNGGAYIAGTRTLTWTFATLSASGSVTFQTMVDPATISRAAPTVNIGIIDSNETARDSGQDSVTVTVVPPPLAGTPTPRPALPNTAVGIGMNGEPVTVPIELLVAFFLGSLGALALANVRASNRRR